MNNRKSFKIKRGDFYADCNYRPMRCTYVNRRAREIEGVSLLDEELTFCRIGYCNPRKISQVEAEKLVAIWEENGERGAMRWAGWSEENIEKFMKEWRKEEK